MGQEIISDHFSQQPAVGGFELEGWLADAQFRPLPRNAEFLQAINNPLATTELAKFNIELNTPPRVLADSALTEFESSLRQLLAQADQAADTINAKLY